MGHNPLVSSECITQPVCLLHAQDPLRIAAGKVVVALRGRVHRKWHSLPHPSHTHLAQTPEVLPLLPESSLCNLLLPLYLGSLTDYMSHMTTKTMLGWLARALAFSASLSRSLCSDSKRCACSYTETVQHTFTVFTQPVPASPTYPLPLLGFSPCRILPGPPPGSLLLLLQFLEPPHPRVTAIGRICT